MTNEEKIKEMNTEEMAKFISELLEGCEYGKCPANHLCGNGDCKDNLMEWLKQEAEEWL